MNSNRYSISADSRRWWWPSAVAGAAALAATMAIPMAAGHAIPLDDQPVGTGAGVTSEVATPVDTDERPCFMVRAHRNEALDWPQPLCGTAPARVAARAADCPPPPDIRYVGIPWVPAETTGCASVDRWWTVVSARGR